MHINTYKYAVTDTLIPTVTLNLHNDLVSNCKKLKAHVCCDEMSALDSVLLLVDKHNDGVSHISGCYCGCAFHRAF